MKPATLAGMRCFACGCSGSTASACLNTATSSGGVRIVVDAVLRIEPEDLQERRAGAGRVP